MVRGLAEREFLRETFGKYVSQEIRDEILAGRVALEGQLREATILFADLRDFTPWVEASDPREVVRDLNAYFTEMETAIRNHGGLVLQYIGDEIEAVFGAPVTKPGHAEHAVRAAQEMRRAAGGLERRARRTGRPPLRNGIGVHTGRGAGRQHRQRRPPVLRARRRCRQPRLAHPGAHEGAGHRRAGQRHDASRLNGELPLTPLPVGAGEGPDGRGRGLRARLRANRQQGEAVGESQRRRRGGELASSRQRAR